MSFYLCRSFRRLLLFCYLEENGLKFYFLNCQIKLEKNYLLIRNILYEYF